MKKKERVCFVCKKKLVLTEQIKREGKNAYGRWYLCWECSAAYRKTVQAQMDKTHWQGGHLCPSCESENIDNDHTWPLRTIRCEDCGFTFTLWLYVDERGATGLVKLPSRGTSRR